MKKVVRCSIDPRSTYTLSEIKYNIDTVIQTAMYNYLKNGRGIKDEDLLDLQSRLYEEFGIDD